MTTRITITTHELNQMHRAARALSVLLSYSQRTPLRDGALFLTDYMLQGYEMAQKRASGAPD